MTPETWQRLEQLFEEAIGLAPPERDAFCARACGEDRFLLEELRSLLRAHEADAGMLDEPVPVFAGSDSAQAVLSAGTRIGVWRIRELIQRGGAGEVYFATRADGAFDQQVALKLLYRDAAPDVERFRSERQILANLEHPGIARLLDGGVSDDGRPYAVVEYVDGETLTAHCDARQADLAYRLTLFVQVCEVVAYAHQSLIVHRDLKPGNILVTPNGRVKLLDFGVAKRLDLNGKQEGDATRTPITFDYAAPEQLTGQAVTTATDVYALGVLLFELLSGERPWKSSGMAIARLVQSIVHDEPALASRTAVATPARPIPARRLAGDLDAIISTSLRKDAADRYPTVEALKRDIERHLACEPVVARGRARLYVLARGLRRYRWAAMGGALVVASLAIGLTTTAWHAHRAEVERDAARRSATREEALRYYLTSMFRASIANKGGAPVTAKAMLDRSAQRVLQQYRDDPVLAGKVVVTLTDLYAALEDVEGQAPLLEGFLAAAGAEADRESVALAQQKLAHIELMRGNVQRAAELLPKAEAVWSADAVRYREQHLESMFVRGLLQRNQGDLPASIQTYRQAIAGRIALSGDIHKETANLYNSLAITLTGANRVDEALDAYRKTLAIYAKLGQGEDLDALIILGNSGTLAFRTGRLGMAEQTLQTAFEKQRERAGDSAAVAASMGLYGAALTAKGRYAQAGDVLQTATDMAVKFAGAASPLAIQDRLFLTDNMNASGQFGKARELAAKNLSLAIERYGEAGLLSLRVRIGRARIELDSGNAAVAHQAFSALVEPLRKAGAPAKPSLAHALLGCGEALLAQGKAAEAVAPLRETVKLREDLLWSQSWELADARIRLGEALRASRQPGAVELMTQGAADLASQLGDAHPKVVRARSALVAAGQ